MAFTPKLMIVEPSAEDRRPLVSAPFLRQQSEWDSEILRTHLRNIRQQYFKKLSHNELAHFENSFTN